MMQASTLRLTSRSMTSSMTTPLLLRSMAMAQHNAATSRLARQGALAALQRSSSDADRRTKARQVTSEARHHQALRQREALEQQVRKDHDVGKIDEGNEGV